MAESQGKSAEKDAFINLRSPSDIAILVYNLRTRQSLTQAALSKMTGIKQQTISAIESGKQNPEMKTLFIILSSFNLELVVRSRVQRSGGFAPGREGV